MTRPDIPTEAVEAAARRLYRYDREQAKRHDEWPEYEDLPSGARSLYRSGARDILAAALPHLRERWLAEVEGALRHPTRFAEWRGATQVGSGNILSWAADYLRDVFGVGAGGEGGDGS